MSVKASQITDNSDVCSTVCSVNNKENSKHYLSFVNEGFPAQVSSNAESVSVLWRNNAIEFQENRFRISGFIGVEVAS